MRAVTPLTTGLTSHDIACQCVRATHAPTGSTAAHRARPPVSAVCRPPRGSTNLHPESSVTPTNGTVTWGVRACRTSHIVLALLLPRLFRVPEWSQVAGRRCRRAARRVGAVAAHVRQWRAAPGRPGAVAHERWLDDKLTNEPRIACVRACVRTTTTHRQKVHLQRGHLL